MCVHICIHVIIVSVVVTLSGIWPCVWRWALNKSSLSLFFLLLHACSLSHCGTSWGAAGTTQPPFRRSWPRRCWRRFRTSSCPTCSATTSNPNPRSSAKAPSLQSTPSPSQSSDVFCGYRSLPLLRAVMCSVSTIHPPPPPHPHQAVVCSVSTIHPPPHPTPSPSSDVFCIHHSGPLPFLRAVMCVHVHRCSSSQNSHIFGFKTQELTCFTLNIVYVRLQCRSDLKIYKNLFFPLCALASILTTLCLLYLHSEGRRYFLLMICCHCPPPPPPPQFLEQWVLFEGSPLILGTVSAFWGFPTHFWNSECFLWVPHSFLEQRMLFVGSWLILVTECFFRVPHSFLEQWVLFVGSPLILGTVSAFWGFPTHSWNNECFLRVPDSFLEQWVLF